MGVFNKAAFSEPLTPIILIVFPVERGDIPSLKASLYTINVAPAPVSIRNAIFHLYSLFKYSFASMKGYSGESGRSL